MSKTLKSLLPLVLLVGLAVTGGVQALTTTSTSLKLTDTIVKGVGDLNLFNNMSASQLEGYRATYGSGVGLSFGVDVNEAANGTEKASSQGVMVADAWLEVVISGVTKTYGHSGNFSTETKALVAPVNTTARSSYYTLLGETGSARITSNGSIQKIFDSTLKIMVPDSLVGATTAVLHVRFLDPNVKLGDPEAFYDFTAGFEDVAILSAADSKYIDEVVPTETTFRTESPAMQLSPEGVTTQTSLTTPPPPPPLSWIQKPGAGSYNIVAYEDLYPMTGDYDFNDAVVAYRYELGVNASGLVERIDGVAYLIARGSTYTHNWTLDIPLPATAAANIDKTCSTVNAASAPLAGCLISVGGSKLSWTAFSDTVAAFPGPGATPVNTPAGSSPVRGPKATFSLSFAGTLPKVTDFGVDDPWLYVRNTSQSIHLSNRDGRGYPFAMMMPSTWKIPVEYTDMGFAYPALSTFISSSGIQAKDWHLQPVTQWVKSWAITDWVW